MRRVSKLISIGMAACLLTLSMGMNVLAASTISGVSIKVESNLQPGDRLPDISFDNEDGVAREGEVRVSTSSSKYYIESAEWTTSTTKNMTIGEEAKMRIYLYPDYDHYFKGTYHASNVSIKGGTFVSAQRKGDQLVVSLKMNPIKGSYEPPAEAYWTNSRLGEAKWVKGENSSNTYDVMLYHGTSLVKKLEAKKAHTYNFYPYMTKPGTYRFKVRTVAGNETERKYAKSSEWLDSDEIYIAKEDVSDGKGQESEVGGNTDKVGWIQNGNSWYYKYPDGTIQKNSWMKNQEKWYLFDANGVMQTGWHQRNNRWYFLHTDGAMATNWLNQNEKWYYLNPISGDTEGAMSVGWIQAEDKWYLAGSDGALLTGWRQVDGNWYYFYPNNFTKAVNTNIDGFDVDESGIWKK